MLRKAMQRTVSQPRSCGPERARERAKGTGKKADGSLQGARKGRLDLHSDTEQSTELRPPQPLLGLDLSGVTRSRVAPSDGKPLLDLVERRGDLVDPSLDGGLTGEEEGRGLRSRRERFDLDGGLGGARRITGRVRPRPEGKGKEEGE
jgi:hypothetical protein